MLKEVKQVLFARRAEAEMLADKNLKKALQDEEFANSFRAEKAEILLQAKKKAFGEDIDPKNLKALQDKTNKALKNLGLSRKDIEPQYKCKKCNDKGVVDNKTCDCVNDITAKIIMQKSQIHKLKTFEESNLDIFGESSDLPNFYKIMQNWIAKQESDKKIVFLSGASGTGKTFLMECMASKMFKNGKFVVFCSAFELTQDFLNYHTNFNGQNQDILDKYFDCDALFIDDLGSEPIYKNVSVEYLYQILERRSRLGRRTIITSNLGAKSIRESYGERCFSRLFNNQISIRHSFKDKDIRLKFRENKENN